MSLNIMSLIKFQTAIYSRILYKMNVIVLNTYLILHLNLFALFPVTKELNFWTLHIYQAFKIYYF